MFAPLPALGLVVVDEEHDASYKQQDNVRYHARDVAIWRARPARRAGRARQRDAVARDVARSARRPLPAARPAARADPRAALPAVHLAPHRAARALDGIGEPLRDAIAARLARGEQSLVFVNRRGFAPSLICAACKWEAQCPRCSARLTTHRVPPSLRCHHCGHAERVPRACPSCGNVDLVPLGSARSGSSARSPATFPGARIARVDRDSTRAKHAFAAVRDRVEANELDILVGTQMLAKGHDFPRLTLVGVLGADNALYSADFRATERLAALLVQVAGRAGRAGLPGEVIVQTDFPEHPVYAALALARLRALRRRAARRARGRAAAAVRARGAARGGGAPPRRRRRVPRRRARRGTRARRERMRDVERVLAGAGAARAARGLRARPARRAERAAAGAAAVPARLARGASTRIPGRRVRWSIDVDPAGFG